MRNICVRFILILFYLLTWSGASLSAPITAFEHLSNYEVTGPPPRGPYDDVIWFWTYDSLYGRVHSNGWIGIKYNPHFFGQVSTSQEDFRYFGQDNPYFRYQPIFNAPPILFPRTYPNIIQMADSLIEDGDGRLMTRIVLKGEDGIDIHQYPLGRGSPEPGDEDDLIRRIEWIEHGAIAVDGLGEVYGVLFGRLTIYSTRDMYLLDNVIYSGADPRSGNFDEENCPHFLGLVSEKNIIIRNNYHNGKEDGFRRYGPAQIDRHSISINGSLIALDQSFTFEHQNDVWDAYQGPDPWDERGIIHLRGSVAQWRRGYLHRRNHRGTGYVRDYRWDRRLRYTAPPGLERDIDGNISGNYDRLVLDYGSYNVSECTARKLFVRAGVEVKLRGMNALIVTDSLIISGTSEEPVVFNMQERYTPGRIQTAGNENCVINISHAGFSPEIRLQLSGRSIVIDSSTISGEVYFRGGGSYFANQFGSKVQLHGSGDIRVEKCLFKDGLKLTGDVGNGLILNNTITGSRHDGLEILIRSEVEIVNNIIAFNGSGVLNRNLRSPLLRYNNVYQNRNGNYMNCEPGEGSIEEDPLFNNFDSGDYHLTFGSPCIDAGDPEFERDPDGSIVEMGAFYYDHALSVESRPIVASGYDVTVSPNPFNRKAYISIDSDAAGVAYINVYDLTGRKVYFDVQSVKAGVNRFTLDGRKLGGAGVYLVQVMIAGEQRVVKVVYLS